MPAEIKLTDEQIKMIDTMTQALPFLRKEIGRNQTELAKKVGVTRQTISLIERRQQNMTWTLFLAIVFFFKSNNNFDRKSGKIIKKHPNVVEQMMLLNDRLNNPKED